MGYGSYSYTAHQALTSQRAALPTQQVFGQRGIHPKMNPFGVKVRECRDSADHPRSLGVVFALDVSGSMGAIPEALARKELPTFMKSAMTLKAVLTSVMSARGRSQTKLSKPSAATVRPRTVPTHSEAPRPPRPSSAVGRDDTSSS